MAKLIAFLRRFTSDPSFSSLAKGSILTLLLKVSSAVLTYVMFVLFARVMTAEAFGEFSMGFNLGTVFAVLASLGAHVGITRWWPEYNASGEDILSRKVLYWGAAVTATGAAAGSLILAASGVIAINYWSSDLGYVLVAATLVGPIAFAEYFSNALRAQGSVFISQIPKDLAWRIGGCLVALLSAWFAFPLSASTALLCISGILAFLIAAQFSYIWRKAPYVSTSAYRLPREKKREWYATMGPLWGAALLHAFVQYIDVLLVGFFLGSAEAGEYFAVVRTANLMGLMLVASTMICAPLISKYVHTGDIATLQRMLRVVSVIITIPTIFAFLMVVVLGQWLLSLFDPAFVTGYTALVVLGFGHTLNALCGAVGYTLMLSGHEGRYFRIMVISYAGVLAFQLVAIPLFGIVGAALGASIGMVVWNMWARHVAITKVGVDSTVFCLFKRRQTALETG